MYEDLLGLSSRCQENLVSTQLTKDRNRLILRAMETHRKSKTLRKTIMRIFKNYYI